MRTQGIQLHPVCGELRNLTVMSGTGSAKGPEDEPRHGDGWRPNKESRRTRLLLTTLAAVLVLAAVAFPPLSLWPRVLLALVGSAVGLLAWTEPNRRREVSPRTVTHDGVTGLLVPLRSVSLVVPVALGLLSVAFLATTLGLVITGLEHGNTYTVVSSVGGLALAVVLGCSARLALLLRDDWGGDRGGLLLTSQSVHPRGPGRVVLDWDEITDTRAHWLLQPQQQGPLPAPRILNYLRLGLTPEGETTHVLNPEVAHTGAFSLPVDDYAVDPHRLRALLEHYLTEPGDRHELGTAAALTRWRAAPGRPPYRR